MDAGEYIERVFPFLGVRFIAINDHYDSANSNVESDELIVPVKNLINEAYCRDTSIKIRSQLEIKRKRGDFIGSFAVFGYMKDPKDGHRLLVDDYAADVVRDIFKWKLEGISAGDIADRLNKAGIPTPMDYKHKMGMHIATKFRVKAESVWSAGMILRILKNPIYTGVLEQGKVSTPNYKVKKAMMKPRDEWAVVEDNHAAIIDRFDFDTVQRVLALDTRTSVSGKAVELFSGMVYCGECGAAMIRKTVPSGKKKYVYYVCAAHKNEKSCYSHSIRDSVLEEIVLESLKQHIRQVVDLSDLLDMTDIVWLKQAGIQRLQVRLEKKQEEIDRCEGLLRSLYENLVDEVIDREEYQDLKKTYARRKAEAEEQAEGIRQEMAQALDNSVNGRAWMEQFRKNKNITSLDRTLVVSLIERILVYRDRRIEIVFRWQNEFHWQMELLERVRQTGFQREAV